MRQQRLQLSLTSALRATAALAPLLALALASGCGDSSGGPVTHPVPGCEEIDATPCDVRTSECQTRLFALAACLRGDAASERPPVTVVTEAEFAAMAAAEAAASAPQPHLASWDWALSSLRLIQAGALSPESQTSLNVVKIWGLYRHATKDILVVDHGAFFNATTASIVLVHEMVHALQFREMQLTDLAGMYAASRTDTRLAIKAMIEGEARMQDTRYEPSALGLEPSNVDWSRRFENAVTRDEMTVLEDPSPFEASSFTFPYEWGARYLYFVWRAQGMAGVHALFASPPTTTRVLIASTDAALGPEEVPETPRFVAPPDNWSRVGNDMLGAWNLFLALAQSGTRATAAELHELALKWRMDELALYEQATPPATAFLWRIDLSDELTADRVRQLLAIALPGIMLRQQGASVLAARSSDGQPLDWAFAAAVGQTTEP